MTTVRRPPVVELAIWAVGPPTPEIAMMVAMMVAMMMIAMGVATVGAGVVSLLMKSC
jgi:hypothetical protein